MTRCADALKYVPHLRVCRVRDRAPDDSWQLIEHEIDFGWYAPRVKYVFRADFVADRSITFHQVSGDFKANEGVWEFEPLDAGAPHAAAVPRLHRSAGLRAELAGPLDLQARTAADADRICGAVVRPNNVCAPRRAPLPTDRLRKLPGYRQDAGPS